MRYRDWRPELCAHPAAKVLQAVLNNRHVTLPFHFSLAPGLATRAMCSPSREGAMLLGPCRCDTGTGDQSFALTQPRGCCEEP